MEHSRFAVGNGAPHRHNRDYRKGTRVRQREVVFYGFFRRGLRTEAGFKIASARANNQKDTTATLPGGSGGTPLAAGLAMIRWAKSKIGLTITRIFLYRLDGFAIVTFIPESARNA
jgi:hypothetical protein